MKKIVSAFVIVLALAGAAASVKDRSAVAQRPTPRPGSLPTPTCPPSDPNACGMGKPT